MLCFFIKKHILYYVFNLILTILNSENKHYKMENKKNLSSFKKFQVMNKERFQGGDDGTVNKPKPPIGTLRPKMPKK